MCSSLTGLFSSFGTVVLALKVILSQHDLDKPFSGGLGSFKLYVMVAHHVSARFDRLFTHFAFF
jgi:hypothetical protein